MLGRAPSPTLSAKRGNTLRVLRKLRRARAPALPVLTGAFQIRIDF
jgi:hypothetical protein